MDQIYDGLLASGVRPFVELSFMPRALASKDVRHTFWYHPVIAPPKDYRRWDALIEALARHLVERYGIDEVRQWYFEVWNEPNLDFWAGSPRQQTYWTLYEHTARALKLHDQGVRVMVGHGSGGMGPGFHPLHIHAAHSDRFHLDTRLR